MAVEAATANAATQVAGAISRAAQRTGTSFQYLLATARIESNLNPRASVSTSSARGLFQFIEQTWLSTMKDSGRELGYGRYADAIVRTPSGRMVVPDAGLRREILNLRQDAAANAAMAGAFTQANARKLTARLGRPPSEGELYMAHFLGPSGAARLITAAEASPQARAADLFPHAARANARIFFERSGEARSLSQVAAVLAGKFQVARAAASAQVPGENVVPQLVANRDADAGRQSMRSEASTASPSFGQRLLNFAAIVAGTAPDDHAPATSTPTAAPSASAPESSARVRTASAFAPERADAVAPLVTDLWGVRRADVLGVQLPPRLVQAGGQGFLNLFRDGPAGARELFAKS